MQKDNDGYWKEPSSLGKDDLHPQDASQDAALVPSPPGMPNNVQGPRRLHLKPSLSSTVQPQVDVDVQANNIRARERVEIMRGRVFRSRRKIQDVREDVRQLRERQREASAELMKATYQLMALDNVQSLESLRPLFKKASDAQDELGPAEEEYDRIESRLSYEEQELEQEEKFFYTHNNISLRPLPDEELERSLSPLVKPYEPEDEPQNASLDDENVQAYLLQMAKAQTLNDSLDKMEMDYYKITEEARFRRRHDLELSRESATFLAKYDDLHQTITDELYDVEDELYNLRDRCLDLHLFGEDDYVYTRRDALVEDIMESVNEARERSPLRTAAQRHLHEPDFSNKRDYVNAWMLEAVQDSTFEAHRLRAYIYFEFAHPPQRSDQGKDQEMEQAKELNEDQWPDLAMSLWDKDTAGTRTNEIYMLSQMDEITGGAETDSPETTKLSDWKSFESDKKDRSVFFEEEDFVDIETIEGQGESITTKRTEFTPNTTERRPSNDIENISSPNEKFQGLRST